MSRNREFLVVSSIGIVFGTATKPMLEKARKQQNNGVVSMQMHVLFLGKQVKQVGIAVDVSNSHNVIG